MYGDKLSILEHKKECNFVVLAEYKDNIRSLCNELSLEGKDFRPRIAAGCDRIVMLEDCCATFEWRQPASYYAICRVVIFGQSYLIVGAHLDKAVLDTAEEFKKVLATILGSQRVISILKGLLSFQS